MNRKDEERFRKLLLGLREDLKALVEESSESRAVVELDQTRQGRLSRMDALQGQAMAQATNERRLTELRKIEAALTRLEEGDFGFCVSCGEEIEPKRLEFDPATPLCLDCAQS